MAQIDEGSRIRLRGYVDGWAEGYYEEEEEEENEWN